MPLGQTHCYAHNSKLFSCYQTLSLWVIIVTDSSIFIDDLLVEGILGQVSSDRTGPTDQDIRTTYTLNTMRIRINRSKDSNVLVRIASKERNASMDSNAGC